MLNETAKREIYTNSRQLAGMLETAGHACIMCTSGNYKPFLTIGDKAEHIQRLQELIGGSASPDSRNPQSWDLIFRGGDAAFIVEATKDFAPSLKTVQRGYEELKKTSAHEDQRKIHDRILDRFSNVRPEEYQHPVKDSSFLAGVLTARAVLSTQENWHRGVSTIYPVVEMISRNLALMAAVAEVYSINLRTIPAGTETKFNGRRIISTHDRASLTVMRDPDVGNIVSLMINYSLTRADEAREYKELHDL